MNTKYFKSIAPIALVVIFILVFPAIAAQNKPVSSHEGLSTKFDIASDFQSTEKERQATPKNRLLLTKAEQEWLKAHPVITLGCGLRPPSVFIDDKGNKVGISVDYINLLGTMLGVEFRIAFDTLGSSLSKVRKKEIDGILGIFRSPERETYLNFTEPYASSYIAIVMRNTSPKAASYRDLAGKRVAAEKGDYIAGYLAANYPDIKLSSDFPDYQSALNSLVIGDVDAAVGALPVLSWYMDKMLISDISVTGLPPETYKTVSIGIRKDWPEFATILDKAINSVSDFQFRKITRKYISVDIGPPLQKAALSDEEKAWIKANPVIEIRHQNIPPYSLVEYGVHKGYQVEMMNFMLRLVGLRSNYDIISFHKLPDGMRDGRIDVGLDIIYSRERADYMLFSDRPLRITMAIFARNDRRDISDLSSLKGKTIASYHGYVMEKKLRTLLPDSPVVHADDREGMFRLVAAGKTDFCVQEIASGDYILRKEHINYVESKGILEIPGEPAVRAHNFSVRKNLPILKSILDKADRAVDPAEKQRIWHRWFTSEPYRAIELTPEEQDWLREHPVIRLASDNDWMPIESINERDEFQGIAADYIRLIQKRLGAKFQTSPVKPWSEILEMVEKRELDLFTAAMETEVRKTYAMFTKPYISYPMLIITTDKVDYVDGLKGLYEKKIAIPKGYAITDFIFDDHPDLDFVLFNDLPSTLMAVSKGKAYACIVNLVTASHAMRTQGITNLKVSGDVPYRYELSLGVRSDWPELAPILQKALDSISSDEKNAIFRKWIPVAYEPRVDYTIIWWISIVGGIMMAFFFYWNRRLAREVVVRKRTETALIEARKTADAANQSKSRFLAHMSHELRTPLNAILGFSQNMQRDKDLKPVQIDKLAIINRSGAHLLTLINDVLEISKIEAGRTSLSTQDLDLHEFFRTLKDMFAVRAEEKGLSLHFDISPDSPRFIHIDSQKLRQILINLLSNAVKFTEKGGIILRAAYRAGSLIIEVEDTGIAMDSCETERIFEPFFQAEAGRRSHEGTGLGLAICRRFIKIMGGNLSCKSTPGKGSIFSFAVPAPAVENSDAVCSISEQRIIGLQPGQPDYRILVVEDHADSRKLLAELLQSVGFTVKTAINGEEAVQIADSWRPDLIWMDISMPVMDGLEATCRIKTDAEGANAKIVALTAHAFEKDREKIMAAGCDDFIRKPYQETEIFNTLQKHLGVEYIYTEQKSSFVAESENRIDKQALAALPHDWLMELREVIKTLNPEAARQVISKIEKQNPELAEKLQGLIKNFRFDILNNLIKEIIQ